MAFTKNSAAVLAFILAGLPAWPSLAEDISRGEAIYQDKCAGCHELQGSKAPSLASLRQMGADYLSTILTEGKMTMQGHALEPSEQEDLIVWLAKDQIDETDWETKALCGDRSVELASHATGNVVGVGYGHRNLRHQSHTTITPENVASLKLDKVLAFPGATEMRAQPALVGDTLFLAIAETNTLYALDAKEMCIKWTHKTELPLRSAVGYGKVEGRDILFFGAAKNVHVVDALTGQALWSHSGHFFALVTAQPVLHGNTLYVAQSAWELFGALNPDYECCQTSGSVTALDALTGEVIWQTNTTPPATKQGKTSAGTQIWGPSGAPVWSTPTLDEERGLLYVGTGENYTRPTTDTSDAILALDLETGEIRWKFQGTADDAYNAACRYWMGLPDRPGCPEDPGKDLDFGASVMIVTDADGKELLIAGQKSGMVYALDPDHHGSVVWQTRLSDGNLMGGVHWNMSAMDGKIFAAVSDPPLPLPDYTPRPGLSALNVTTGEVVWHHRVARSCTFSPTDAAEAKAEGRRPDCPSAFGLSAGVTTAPGLVFTSALDGQMRAHDAETGNVLWQVNTAVPFTSTNGPEGHGGAIDNNTLVIRDDRLYVQSGYGQFMDQPPGNVLLVYKLKEE